MEIKRTPPSKSDDDVRASGDLVEARAELLRLQKALDTAQQVTEETRTHAEKSRRNTKYLLRVTAIVMLVAALIKLAWVSAHSPAPGIARAVPLPPVAASISIPMAAKVAETRTTPSDLQLSLALNRLGDAFRAFPEDHQRDVVAEINRKHPGDSMACPLAWNDDGVPSLFVGGDRGVASLSVVKELNRCADEVEELSAEKRAAKVAPH